MANAAQHRFMHFRFESGNVFHCGFAIPAAPRTRARFYIHTLRPLTERDAADYETWVEDVRRVASRIAGRPLKIKIISPSMRIPAGVV